MDRGPRGFSFRAWSRPGHRLTRSISTTARQSPPPLAFFFFSFLSPSQTDAEEKKGKQPFGSIRCRRPRSFFFCRESISANGSRCASIHSTSRYLTIPNKQLRPEDGLGITHLRLPLRSPGVLDLVAFPLVCLAVDQIRHPEIVEQFPILEL